MRRKTVNSGDSILKEIKTYVNKESIDYLSALQYILRIRFLAHENSELMIRKTGDTLEAKAELEEWMFEELKIENL